MTKPLQGALFKRFRDQIMGTVAAQDPGCEKKKKPKRVCWETAAPTKDRPYKNQGKTRTLR